MVFLSTKIDKTPPSSPPHSRGSGVVRFPSLEWFLSSENRGGFKYSPRFAVQPAKSAARFRWGRWQFYNKAFRFFQFPFLDELGNPLVQSSFVVYTRHRDGLYPSIAISSLLERYLQFLGVRQSAQYRLERFQEKKQSGFDFESLPWKKFKSGYFLRTLGTRFFLPNSRTRFYRLPRTTRRIYYKNQIALHHLQLLSFLFLGLERSPFGVRRFLLSPLPGRSVGPVQVVARKLFRSIYRFARRALPAERLYWFKLLSRIRAGFRPNFQLWTVRSPLFSYFPLYLRTFLIPSSRDRVVVCRPLSVPTTLSTRSLLFTFFRPRFPFGVSILSFSRMERWWWRTAYTSSAVVGGGRWRSIPINLLAVAGRMGLRSHFRFSRSFRKSGLKQKSNRFPPSSLNPA